MALTDIEKQLMQQVKEQGGSAQDFKEVLNEFRRRQQPVEVTEQAEVTETPEEITVREGVTITPTPDPGILTVDKLGEIAKQRQDEELLGKGFFSEVGESAVQRGKNVAEIKQRFDDKIARHGDEISQAFQQEGPGAAFVQSMQQSLDTLGTSFQTIGQGAGLVGDAIFEGLENAIQVGLPKDAELAIARKFKQIGESEGAQGLAESYEGFRERKPELARNIEASLNIGQFIPIGGAIKKVSKPFTKAGQQAAKESAEQTVKDLSRGLLNTPTKTTSPKQLELGKFFADNVKPVDTFDEVAKQFDDLGKNSIKQVDDALKASTSLHRPQGAKEVLNVIQENLKNVPFSSTQKKTINNLLKKFDSTGLSLSDLNKIKRSISDYTRSWTQAGKEAAGLAPEAIRGKYSEIRKFIENVAKKEGLPDIKQLNQNWINSDELLELLNKQATSVGKKKGLEALAKSQEGLIRRGLEKAGELGTMPFRSVLGKTTGIDKIDLKKALNTLKKTSEGIDKPSLLESIGKIGQGKGLGKAGSAKSAGEAVKTLGKETAKKRFDIKSLKKIGEGSDRIVYDLGDGKVLKVAKNPRGIEQNLNALNVTLQEKGIIPKVDEVGKDFVIMKKLKTFDELSPADKQIANNLVKDVEGLLAREADVPEIKRVLGKYGWEEIGNLDIKSFGWGDIKPKNLSVVNGKPVLLDEGTVDLIRNLKKYKRKVVLAPVKAGAVAGLVTGLDAETIYDIGGRLFGGDQLKKNSLQENQQILSTTPRG